MIEVFTLVFILVLGFLIGKLFIKIRLFDMNPLKMVFVLVSVTFTNGVFIEVSHDLETKIHIDEDSNQCKQERILYIYGYDLIRSFRECDKSDKSDKSDKINKDI